MIMPLPHFRSDYLTDCCFRLTTVRAWLSSVSANTPRPWLPSLLASRRTPSLSSYWPAWWRPP